MSILQGLEDSKTNHSKEEMARLNKQTSNLSHVGYYFGINLFLKSLDACCVGLFKLFNVSPQENEQLRGSLLQAQTNIAILHSELDKLKNMYTDQKAQYER